jgi:hypothetical protein
VSCHLPSRTTVALMCDTRSYIGACGAELPIL